MIGRFFKNKSLVTLVGSIICVIIIVFFYNYRVNKKIDMVTIPVAKVRLDGRKQITEDDLKKIKVARSLLSENVIINEQKIIGKYVDYNTFVPEGGMFYTSEVVEWEDMPDSTWSDISEGKTIVYLNIKDSASYGNQFFPGDRIDLYVETSIGGKLAYGRFVESIKILAVKDDDGNHIFEKKPSTGKPAQLIFELDEENFLLMTSATRMSELSIVPVPRNSQYTADDKDMSITTEQIKTIIKNNYNMLQPDNIEVEDSDIEIIE